MLPQLLLLVLPPPHHCHLHLACRHNTATMLPQLLLLLEPPLASLALPLLPHVPQACYNAATAANAAPNAALLPRHRYDAATAAAAAAGGAAASIAAASTAATAAACAPGWYVPSCTCSSTVFSA
jgi:hypothetical protein